MTEVSIYLEFIYVAQGAKKNCLSKNKLKN